jgi:hypothetical protein
MPTLTVIKHFDVIKNIAAYFFPCYVDLFLYPFTLQAGKSFLQLRCRDSYLDGSYCPPVRVISGTTATHDLCTDFLDQNEPAPFFGVTSPYGHHKRIQDNIFCHPGLHCPADNFAREQVNNYGQIQIRSRVRDRA